MSGNPQRPPSKKPMPERPGRPVSGPAIVDDPNGPIEDPPGGGQLPGDDTRRNRDKPPVSNS